MSYPPRPPMVPGMPPLFMGVPGMPPSMGIPPPMMPPGGAHPPGPGNGGIPYFGGHMRPGVPSPLMRPPVSNCVSNTTTIAKPPTTTSFDEKPSDHPQPMPIPAGPPVTVFVGNITERWPDAMIRQLLATCGQVINWKRVQGASGKLQAFGFCEFNGPDAGLRAVRLLHDLEVGDKKLVVKVDAKTNTVLEEFKADRKKKRGENASNGSNDGKSEDGEIIDYMDKDMLEADERSKQRIGIIFREFKSDLEAYVPAGTEKSADSNANKQQIQEKLHLLKLSSLDPNQANETHAEEPDLPEDLAQDEGKREIITREISIFRESMKQEKQREEERKKLERERREKGREREERRRNRERGAEDITSPDRFSPKREKSGSRERGRGDRGSSRDRRERRREERDRRDRSRERRRRSRERKTHSRSPERVLRSPVPIALKPRYREREEEEEQFDQKRLERKAREKEAAYEDRLRDWEAREAQKTREFRKFRDRMKRQEEDLQREARRMKQFLEDYDDEKHDIKYYRGKDLQRRLADRARELEEDNKDRQREREELEEIKLRMLTSGTKPVVAGSANPTTSVSTLSTNIFDKYKKPVNSETTTASTPALPLFSGLKMELRPSINTRLQAIASSQPPSSGNSNNIETNKIISTVASNSPQHTTPVNMSNPSTPNSINSPAGLLVRNSPAEKKQTPAACPSPPVKEDECNSLLSAPSPGLPSVSPQNFSREEIPSPVDVPKRKRLDIKDVFNQDEDDDGLGVGRKRKLIPLDFGDESKKVKKEETKNTEEKKKNIKALIDKIPTDKDALFAYEVDWEMVDSILMEKRIRPWINKKIVEYIGEPEPTLVDFICSKVLGRSEPQSILEDVVMVLDEEAEVFVVKMWRLLVYEIEAKKFGVASAK